MGKRGKQCSFYCSRGCTCDFTVKNVNMLLETVTVHCYSSRDDTPVLHRPQKKVLFRRLCFNNLRLEAPLPVHDIPSFCHNSSYTSDPKTHHPAKHSVVLSLQSEVTLGVIPVSLRRFAYERSRCHSLAWLRRDWM